MASGQQLARLFQRSCLLFNQNDSKLTQNLDTNSKTGYQKSIVEDLE
jgi:hypothetical protein